MKKPRTEGTKDMQIKLPEWLTRNEAGAFIVDADAAYPIILKALGFKMLDQYAIECAYQCAKMKVQNIADLADGDGPKTITILITSNDKEKWRLTNHPKGRGIEAATRGREAVSHYERIKRNF